MEYTPFKPFFSRLHEGYIGFTLRIAGYDPDLAKSVIGYSPADVPFVYGTGPSYPNNSTLKLELWMGSTVSKEDLTGEWDDQIPEVIVQWWGNTPIKDGVEGFRKISRLEVHHLSDGSFVQHEYRNVSDMGAFDGTLKLLHYYKQKKGFDFAGKHRKQYYVHRIYQVFGMWKVNLGYSNVSSTSMLNAWSQIKEFRMNSIYMVKPESGK